MGYYLPNMKLGYYLNLVVVCRLLDGNLRIQATHNAKRSGVGIGTKKAHFCPGGPIKATYRYIDITGICYDLGKSCI